MPKQGPYPTPHLPSATMSAGPGWLHPSQDALPHSEMHTNLKPQSGLNIKRKRPIIKNERVPPKLCLPWGGPGIAGEEGGAGWL
jgi:hypothetical protein